jgi:hypothetical protein
LEQDQKPLLFLGFEKPCATRVGCAGPSLRLALSRASDASAAALVASKRRVD